MNNEDKLINRLGYYYDLSLRVLKEFGGPSIYFHVQAIKEQENNFLSHRHIEMIYATLASWGMHQMGDTNAKMVEFDIFKESLLAKREELKSFMTLRMDSCTAQEYAKHLSNLKSIYYGLKVSISEATIVAHSKTLAHILPNLVPPIDRQYTIRFFTQDCENFCNDDGKFRPINVPKGIDHFEAFKKFACNIKSLFDRCDCQMFNIDKASFNTSIPKIMDNLIMAFVKDAPRPNKKKRNRWDDLIE